MSYAGIYGFTGLPYTYDENKEAVLDTIEKLSKYLLLQNISFRKLKNKGGLL